MKYHFSEPKNTACLSCVHVVRQDKPILYVSHDDDDGCWQFLCGGEHKEGDAMVVGIGEMVILDPSINDICHLTPGRSATRGGHGQKWVVEQNV